MEGLKRSEVSFRRQGSSGLVWDDKLLNEELSKLADGHHKEDTGEKAQVETKGDSEASAAKKSSPAAELTIERSRSTGGRGYRTGRVSPAIDPPSPKVSACGFCGAFGNSKKTRRRAKKSGKRVM
ncbi:hypothetical protein CASFOL_038668 [Castilleja foliolosa]|uniref:MAPK kinase substrate protein n=1 Tax=Castilleja foliolosa TaxID=1961234 RepID=A0ABD3BNQ5_9LAMI